MRKLLVHDGRRVEMAAVGVIGVAGDLADFDVAEREVQRFGEIAGTGVESEEGASILERLLLDRKHQGARDTQATSIGMDE